MAAFTRNVTGKSKHYYQSVRSCFVPPLTLYPSNVYRKKHILDREEYVDEPPIAKLSWEELQKDLSQSDVTPKTNIGEIWKNTEREPWHAAQQKALAENDQNEALKRASRLLEHTPSLEDVDDIYLVESAPGDLAVIAEHYGIFKDLFDDGHFIPVTDLDVFYNCGSEDSEYVVPVLRGNPISPHQAETAPNVSFAAEDKQMYTLILTNPDGHLTDNSAEYLHWMIGNISGGDIKNGEVLCEYLRPFPPRGTGWHRHVFLLFKHSAAIDLSKYKVSNTSSLKERTFSTRNFYKEYQDAMIPVGLGFFQAQWDNSVQYTYHNLLNMREPGFEYDFPQEYRAPQERHPKRKPFDRYMDKYRDKKDLAEEAIQARLAMTSPFEPPVMDPYWRVYWKEHCKKPTWLRRKEELMHRRVEYFKDIDT